MQTQQNTTELNGKVAIVTGASAGYGEGIAKTLTDAGCKVYATGRNAARLEEACSHTGAFPFVADACVAEDWSKLVNAVIQEAGRIDILVNNAGSGGKVGPFDELANTEIEGILQTNLSGPILGCRAIVPLMAQAGGGTIINVSSVCARYSWPGWAVYSAAKAGLERFSKSLYAEYRERGIRVTTLTPSWGATDFAGSANISGHPMQDSEIRAQCIQPGDLGEVVRHLCATPANLNVLEYTVTPTVQAIEPL